ncbi:hypothetical protein [Oleiharenicola lentus]|uniref:hypothetical protein n=1 Tax=Oleiharenicola lentus TaxID=2508720 RepID=UPI003F676D63
MTPRFFILFGSFALALLVAGGVVVGRHRNSQAEKTTAANTPAVRTLARSESDLLALSRTEPLEAIRLAGQLFQGPEFDRILTSALEELMRTDPATAAKIILTLPAGDFQQIAAGQVATAFAKIDPAGAFTWAQTLMDEKTRLRALREVAATWAESDPVAAASALATLTSDREKQLTALAVATVWTRKNPEEALTWAGTLTPLDARALVLASAAQTWAERDAASAMNWLANQSAEFHSTIDPLTSLAMLAKWSVQDPATVRDFVKTMSPGVGQARAVETVAPQLAKIDPLATMQWALSLENRQLRETAFQRAFRQWTEASPKTAQQWIEAADLTPEEKLRLADYP